MLEFFGIPFRTDQEKAEGTFGKIFSPIRHFRARLLPSFDRPGYQISRSIVSEPRVGVEGRRKLASWEP